MVSADSRTRLARSVGGALLVGLLAAISTVPTHEAEAQGLLGAIFNALGGSPRSFSNSYAPRGHDGRFPAPDFSNRAERPAGGNGGGGTYCVRLCDGRYFPMPRASNGAQLNPAKVCSALCPAAQTQVFNGHPDHAVASDGTRYADLANAFAYRDRVAPDCSCTGRGPGGLAQIDIESDPTLRAGDVVAMAEGLAVFKGANQFPYKTADFTPIESYSKVNADLRRKLSEVRIDPTTTPATPVQKLATGEDPPRAAKPRPRRARAQATDTSANQNWGLFR